MSNNNENTEYWENENVNQNEIETAEQDNVENVEIENSGVESTVQSNVSELSEIEKRKLRAKRFGLPVSEVKISDREKIEQRRKRFGITGKEGKKNKKGKLSNIIKLKYHKLIIV